MTLPADWNPPVLLTMTAREFAVCDDGPIGMWREEVHALAAALAEARQEIDRLKAENEQLIAIESRVAILERANRQRTDRRIGGSR